MAKRVIFGGYGWLQPLLTGGMLGSGVGVGIGVGDAELATTGLAEPPPHDANSAGEETASAPASSTANGTRVRRCAIGPRPVGAWSLTTRDCTRSPGRVSRFFDRAALNVQSV